MGQRYRVESHRWSWGKSGPDSPETMGYTEDDLRAMAMDEVGCRRMTIGLVIDGKRTSCVELQKASLCDNCRQAVATEHPTRQKTALGQSDRQERGSLQVGHNLRPETSSTRPERTISNAGIDPSPTVVQPQRIPQPLRNAQQTNAPERYQWLYCPHMHFFLTNSGHNMQVLRR